MRDSVLELIGRYNDTISGLRRAIGKSQSSEDRALLATRMGMLETVVADLTYMLTAIEDALPERKSVMLKVGGCVIEIKEDTER